MSPLNRSGGSSLVRDRRRRFRIELLEDRIPLAADLYYSLNQQVHKLSDTGASDQLLFAGGQPQISPDGNWLAFRRGPQSDPLQNDLWVRNLQTNSEYLASPGAANGIFAYSFTPNSGQLIFDTNTEIQQFDLQQLITTSLAFTADDAPNVRLSDGQVVVKSGTFDGLATYSSALANRTLIPNTNTNDSMPTWSPDGQWIAFQRAVSAGVYEFYKIKPDGTGLTKLSSSTGPFALTLKQGPVAWSYDGNNIYVPGAIGVANGVYVVPVDGSISDGNTAASLVKATGASPPEYVSAIFDPNLATVATTVSLTTSNPSVAYGVPLTFTATVTPATGTLSNIGSVTFFVNGTQSSTVAVTGNQAILNVPKMLAGEHTVQATFNYIAGYSTSKATVNQFIVSSPLPTGPQVAFSFNNTIHIASLDGSSDTLVTTGEQPVLSRDGRYVAFHRGSSATPSLNPLLMRDLQNGVEWVASVASSSSIVGFDWTVDSNSLTYDFAGQIRTTHRDVQGPSSFTTSSGFDDAPAVNPVTGKLVVHNDQTGGLFTMNSDGTGRTQITGTQLGDYWPRWSPDGQWIVFSRWTSTKTNFSGIYKINPSIGAASLTQLTETTGSLTLSSTTPGAGVAAWSPDGNSIIAAGRVAGVPGLYQFSANPSGPLTISALSIPTQVEPGFVHVIASTRAATDTALTSSANPSSSSGSVTFTATVTSASGIPTGNVTFVLDTGTTVTVALNGSGQAAYTTTALVAGAHRVTARFNDTATHANSSATISQNVTPAASLAVGTKVVFSVGSTIHIANTDGSGDQILTAGEQPKLSSDGRYLAFKRKSGVTNYTLMDLWVRDLTTNIETQIVTNTSSINSFDWTAAGQIVFDLGNDLRRVNRDGTGSTILSSVDSGNDGPTVNPVDGRIAVWNLRATATNGILVGSSSGTGLTLVPNTVINDTWPVWSPDGQWLAFRRGSVSGNMDFYKIRPDGTGLTQLTSTSNFKVSDGSPRASLENGTIVWLDNNTLLASGVTGGVSGIYTIAADGSSVAGAGALALATGNTPTFVGSMNGTSQQVNGSTVTWSSTSGGLWSNPINWSTGRLPGPGDNVVIPDFGIAGANITITFDVPTVVVASLTSNEILLLQGGVLVVTGNLSSTGPVRLNGATLAGATVTAGTTINSTQSGTAYTGTLQAVTLHGTLTANGRVDITQDLTLGSTGVVNIGTGGSLRFDASQSIAGSGNIVFSNGSITSNVTNVLVELDVAPGITIRGGNGTIGSASMSVRNRGTIQADLASQTLTIAAGNFTNTGTLRAQGSTLTNNAPHWNGTGSLVSATGGIINLGGMFTSASIANRSQTGGVFNLTGTLVNTGSNLSVTTGTGPLNLVAGTILGGTINTSGTNDITINTGVTGTLDGVTLNGTARTLNASSDLRIVNNLVLNGTITTVNSFLSFDATTSTSNQTVTTTSSAEIVTTHATSELFIRQTTTSHTVTIGPSVTIRGTLFRFGGSGLAGTWVNQGTIRAETSGKAFTTFASNILINSGSIQAVSGGILTLNSNVTNLATGSITANASTVTFGGSVTRNLGSIVTSASSTLSFSGNWVNQGLISVTNTTVNLGGNFTQSSMGVASPSPGQGQFLRSGGTVTLIGNLTGDLTLDAATGPWFFGINVGGTLRNSRLQSTFDFTSVGNFTFDNVTIAAGTNVQMLGSGNYTLNVINGMTIDGSLHIGLTGGTTYSSILCLGTQTIGGSGSIVFGDSTNNAIRGNNAVATITFGPNLTIRGKSGTIINDRLVDIVLQGLLQPDVAGGTMTISGNNLINQGRIEPTAGSTVIVSSNAAFTNSGQMNVSNGNTLAIRPATFVNLNTITATGGALTLGGQWNNTGSISVASTTVSLAGSFTQFGMGSASPAPGQGTFIRSGGTVNLSGVLTGDLTLDTITGPWTFGGTGGTLRNSTLTSSTEFRSSANFTFENVTIASGTFVRSNHTLASLTALNINGELRIGEGTTSGRLEPSGTQTIGGSGSIVLANNIVNTIATSASSTVTLGPNLTLRGQSGRFSAVGTSTFINQGLIQTDVNGGALTIDTAVTSFINAGRIEPTAGSSITMLNSSFTNNGTIVIAPNHSVRITSTTFSNTNSITATGGSLTLGGTGAWSNTGTINVANTDVTLGGVFTQFGMGSASPAPGQGTFIRSGGTVNLSGVLTGDLTLDTITGPWTFGGTGGTLRNSTLTSSTEFRSSANFAFDNVTIASGTFVRSNHILASLTALNINGELRIGEGTTSGRLEPSGTQTIGGSGSIVLANNIVNTIATSASSTVTLGPNLTLRGQSGRFSAVGTSTFINQGLIQTDVNGGALTIDTAVTSFINAGRIEPTAGSSITMLNSSFTNNGTIVIAPNHSVRITSTTFSNTNSITATGGSLTLGGTGAWSNTGTINVANTDVTLGGVFTQFGMGSASPAPGQGTFIRSGGTVRLSGTLNGDLTLDSATGPWTFGGTGSLRNSILTSSTEFKSFDSTSASQYIFENVTIASGTTVRTTSTLSSLSSLTINGVLRLGDDAVSGAIGQLRFTTSQTIAGNGVIVFGLPSTASALTIGSTGVTITLGPELTVRGGRGGFFGTGTSVFINQGLIQPDGGPGTSITVNSSVSSFTNSGRVEPINASTFSVVNPSFTNTGVLKASGGNTVDIRPTTFTNFTNSVLNGNSSTVTLSGGSYEVDAASLLRIYPGGVNNRLFRVTTLAANVELSGAGSKIVASNTTTSFLYDALRDLSTIAPGATLSLTNGSVFEPFGNLTTAGTVEVDAGSRFGAATTGPNITAGLISNYAAENTADDGTSSNHGALTNGATFGTGISSQAFALDGVNDYVSIPDSPSLRPANVTAQAWIQFSTAPTGTHFVLSKPVSTGGDVSYSLSFSSTAIRMGYNAILGTTPFIPAVGVWYHVAITFDDAFDTIRLYLDGVEQTSATIASLSYGAFPLLIGAGQTTGGVRTGFFPGKIDEVRVLNRALSATELRNEFLNGAASRITQSAGTTVANGAAASQDQYALAGGTLKGSGSLSTPLHQTGGTLAPGNSPGCLTVNGNYTLASAGSLQIELNGATACTQYDRLHVNGSVNLSGSLDMILAPSYVPTVGTLFTILDNDGSDAVVGTFTGLPERQVFLTNSTQIFQISYAGGTGNDIVLKYLGSGVIVTTNAVSGVGSFADAITATNSTPGNDLIAFSLPTSQFSGGAFSISMAASALPTITDSVVIDASTQREYLDHPIIELAGSGTGVGLNVTAANSSIRGLSLTGWTSGINVAAANVTVAGNYVGLKPDGSVPTTRNTTGIAMSAAANTVTIGGTSIVDRNVVSGNSGYGIDINASLNSSIVGNTIGTNPTGQQSRANTLGGIRIRNASDTPNTIGGTVAGSSNLISGNSGPGIEINNSGFQFVLGNTIGLNLDGSAALPNGVGVLITQTSPGNRIGGTSTASRNIISGNTTAEIQLTNGATANEIWGNYIGTNLDGSISRATSSIAIAISSASTGNFIGTSSGTGRNIIVGSGNSIGIQISSSNTNRIVNNWLGVDAAGATPLGYFSSAIVLQDSDQTLIGTTTTGTGNSIVQYSTQGIAIASGSDNTEIYNNLVGIGPSGNSSMFSQSHDRDGILITGSSNTIIGGTAGPVALSNFLGGNRNAISISGTTSLNNQILNNRIGLNVAGTAAIANTRGILVNGAQNTIIGTVAAGQANVISGNNYGIVITADSFGSSVSGNRLGTTAAGATNPGVPNLIQSVLIDGGTRSVINDNVIVRTGTPATPTDNQGVRIANGDAVLRRNLIFDNLGASISVAAPPGTITLTQARIDGFAIGTITGATPNTAFTLEFFAATNPGQAEQYVGTSAVVTEADGTATFEISGLGDLPPAKYLTATITGSRSEGNDIQITSALAAGVIPTSAIIRGLPSRGPEGRPISLKAFAVGSTISGYAVTGYLWQIKKDGLDFARGNEAGIQFAPDDEGLYTVSLTLTQTNAAGDVQLVTLGPHSITISNVAPTPQFEITPNAVRAGQLVTLTSNSSDPGLLDVLSYAWEIRSASPTGPVVASQAFSSAPGATQFQFTPTSGGIYYAVLQVDDGDGGPAGIRSLIRQFEVFGLAQSINIVAPTLGSEGQTVRARAPESELKRAEQLTFTWRVEKQTSAGAVVNANYPFTVPSRGVIEFIPDDDGRYRIFLTVTEVAAASGSVIAPPVDVTVSNTSPVVSINGANSAIIGSPITLTAQISEPRTVDTFTTTWFVERNGQPMPGFGQVGNPDTTFTFTPTLGGVYAITAVATDDDYLAVTNVGRGAARRMVYVPETNVSVAVVGPVGGVSEGQPATFTPVITGATPASYQWHVEDTNGRTLVALGQSGTGATVPNFAFTPPQGGRYLITLSVVFTNSRVASGSFAVNAGSRAPTIDLLSVVSPPSNVVITEGMKVTVRASASDATEPRGLLYRWQLQRPGQSFVNVDGDRRRPTDFIFTPTDDGSHIVRVFVTDSDGNTVQSDLTIGVANALPTVRLAVVGTSGSNVTLQAVASDPGADDMAGLAYAWSVNAGPFASTPSSQFTTTINSPTSIVARVTDDNGSVFARYYFLAGTAGNDTRTLNAVDVSVAQANSADVLAYLGLAGDDQVTADASVTMPLLIVGGTGNDSLTASAVNVPVELDGGDDDDTLISGGGNDVLRAGSGTNVLIGGNGQNRFVGGGNDTMTGGDNDDTYEVHFSTVVINDTGDGVDTVDLSAAPAGITLDFSSTNGLAQSVFPGSTISDPYHNSTLSLNGTFTNLLGSPFSDVLSASTASLNIDGGAGNDQLNGSGVGLNLEGGLGNDTLVLTSATGNFSGGPGNDTLLGSVASGSAIIIDAGDGDDIAQLNGPATGNRATITYYGGAGSNSLTGSRLTGKIFAGSGDSSSLLRAFGVETATASLDLELTNSSDVDIFGTVNDDSQIDVISSQDIDIFGGGNDFVRFNGVTRGIIDGGLFGVRSSPTELVVDISNSSDIDIFGIHADDQSLTLDVSNTSDIDIFGAIGDNDIDIVNSQDIDIFGVGRGSINLGSSTTAAVTRASIHLSNFGVTTAGASITLSILNASDVDIFGSVANDALPLTADIANSSDIDIFGVNAHDVDFDIVNSQDIDIFGVADGIIRLGPTTPNAVGQGVHRATIDVSGFGVATDELSLEVVNSSDVDIFGARTLQGTALSAYVLNSSDIDIFGAVVEGGDIEIVNSQDIDIFSQASASITLTHVTRGTIFTDLFGVGAIDDAVTLTVLDNSSEIDIFGSVLRNADIDITNSQDIDIFGGTAVSITPSGRVVGDRVRLHHVTSARIAAGVFGTLPDDSTDPVMTLDVLDNSSEIDIFGSVEGPSDIVVIQSQDIDIFGGFGDQVNLQNASRVRIEGGIFGVPITGEYGLTVSAQGNSQDIAIFGSQIADNVTLTGGTRVSMDLRDGNDVLDAYLVNTLVAITDVGDDLATINSSTNALVYMGAGRDRGQIVSGTNIRLLGAEEDDEFYVAGGTGIDIDGGNGSDTAVVTGGSDVVVRSDEGNDRFKLFQGATGWFSGGTGDETLQFYGGSGLALPAGQVYAVLDGQSGNDTLEVRPLLTNASRLENNVASPLTSLPAWMLLPAAIVNPTLNTLPSSVALVGGLGDDILTLEGNQRLLALGGDGNDQLWLVAGHKSGLAGGAGDDTIIQTSSGVDNFIFGDEGHDQITLTTGLRTTALGDEGNDTFVSSQAINSVMRGGLGQDNFSVTGGSDMIVSGESGNDTLTTSGGTNILAAGGLGDDQLTVNGGSQVVLLGESGDDLLVYNGGSQAILSGGDGDDTLEADRRDADLYGDDGDDLYKLKPTATSPSLFQLRLRELQSIDPTRLESESRGSDTLDLSGFQTIVSPGGVTIDLRLTGTDQVVIAGQLSLLMNGAFENIIGTPGDDTIIGSPLSNRLDGSGGNDNLQGLDGDDVLIASAGDDTLQGGLGDDQYIFESTGPSLGNDRIIEAVGGGLDWLNFSQIQSAGLGTLDLNQSSLQSLAGGLISLSLRASELPGSDVAEIEDVTGTSGNDTVIGNGLDNRFELLAGNDTAQGGDGSDIYVFGDGLLGSDLIVESDSAAGRDTLDFTALGAPLDGLDLALNTPQTFTARLILQLSSGNSIENVVASSFNDTIFGNALDNVMYGAAGADRLEGRAGNDRLYADLPSIVLLDFDSAFNATRGDYNYSSDERNAIQARIQTDYAQSNWLFTQQESVAQNLSADSGRSVVRLVFSEGRGGGVSGDAGEVDFRNLNRRIVSQVNVNPLLPTVRSIIGNSATPAQYSQAVVALTAGIASHELAHTAGVRHGDAFGPIGTGVYSQTDTSRIYPAYTGPRNASETVHHIISSPASVGTSISDALSETYFGPRESIKLAFAESGQTQLENGIGLNAHANLATAELLGLKQLYVPNNAPSTGSFYSGRVFDVSALAVVGELTHTNTAGSTETDYYRFSGRAGEFVNIELLANSIRPLRGTEFDGRLQIFTAAGQLIAENDDDLEGTLDATLMDVVLPADGEYLVAVSLSSQPATSQLGGRYELLLSRFRVLPVGQTLPAALGDTLVGGPGLDTVRGGAADDLLLARDALAGDLADEVFGGGGLDTLDLLGLDYTYSLATDHAIENIINANIAPSAVITGAPIGAVSEGSAFTISLINATDPSQADTQAGFRFSYVLQTSGGSVISGGLSTSYASAGNASSQLIQLPDNGSFKVIARIHDVKNGFRDYMVDITATNLPPMGTLSGPSTVQLGVPALFSVTANDLSTVDAAALRYAFATDQNSLPNSYLSAGTSSTANLSFSSSGAQTAWARVFDKDGDSITLSQPVTVNGVSTTLTLTGPTAGGVGQRLTYSLAATQVPVGATYQIDWGDGASNNLNATDGTATIEHQFITASSPTGFSVQVRLLNTSSLVVASVSTQVVITSFYTLVEGTSRTLFGGGTAANESITIRKISDTAVGVSLSATSSEVVFAYGSAPNAISRLVINGLNGNDNITVDPTLALPVELYGGGGNDVLRGGSADDILVGGDGNDSLYGNDGKDLLMGGVGRDNIYAKGDQDIAIAGYTPWDQSPQVLRDIMLYWVSRPNDTSDTWYNERVNALIDPSSNGILAGRNFSKTYDDNLSDVITAALGVPAGTTRKPNVYFYNNAGNGVRDSAGGRLATERVIDNTDFEG